MKVLVLILTALAGSPSFAQPPAAAAPAGASASGPGGGFDPNQIVCRSEGETGSRLRTLRRCLTRAQWTESISRDRAYAERAQTNRTYCGGICTRWMTHGR